MNWFYLALSASMIVSLLLLRWAMFLRRCLHDAQRASVDPYLVALQCAEQIRQNHMSYHDAIEKIWLALKGHESEYNMVYLEVAATLLDIALAERVAYDLIHPN